MLWWCQIFSILKKKKNLAHRITKENVTEMMQEPKQTYNKLKKHSYFNTTTSIAWGSDNRKKTNCFAMWCWQFSFKWYIKKMKVVRQLHRGIWCFASCSGTTQPSYHANKGRFGATTAGPGQKCHLLLPSSAAFGSLLSQEPGGTLDASATTDPLEDIQYTQGLGC